ncbi:hypothetical protein SAMN05444484_10847 [Flavobacterium chilense]|uniref:Uncharacterized protein n=1 Tax=Flavobacterium chilense TaxID=946677 RepID=A0A1M7KP28_9FLAO|nr:hypothetical protein SAMN05444484_10847 [Flavobacterium chilense]
MIFLKTLNQNQTANPLKKNQKKLFYLILFGIISNISNSYCQTNNETASVYNWFDSNIGIESLDFENGPAHLNFDRISNNQNRYYISENFEKGNIRYNNQDYFDLLLNYDTYSDELILKPYGESNTTKVNLIKENVSSFKIRNEKFVNLKMTNSIPFKKGYYEEVLIKNSTTLFIKHYKEKKKINKAEIDLIEFAPKYDFILLRENKFYQINDKKEIILLFPNDKKKINDFYFDYRSLKKDNPPLFMKNLLKSIN